MSAVHASVHQRPRARSDAKSSIPAQTLRGVVSGAMPAVADAQRHGGVALEQRTRSLMESGFASAVGAAGVLRPGSGSLDPMLESQADSIAERVVDRCDDPAAAMASARAHFDFGSVRIHANAESDRAARALGAHAFTIGNDVFFGRGAYSPGTTDGHRLLAHELSHVLQQSGEPTPALQMKRTDLCTSAWTCAGGDACNTPDAPPRADAKATSWALKVMIDVEAASAAEVDQDTIGHTYVEFSDNAGAVYTYGFYPNKAAGTPDPITKPAVFGCMVHPDTAHKACIDHEEKFALTEEQYSKSLQFAQTYCRAPERYHVQTNNCVTFAVNVARLAGQTLPPVRGSVSRAGVKADNPNTLYEGIKRRDVGPTWGRTGDTELREAIAAATNEQLASTPAAEKARVINRLLKGWISDDDVAAIEALCAAVQTRDEMRALRDGTIEGVRAMMMAAQQRRVNAALVRL